MVYRYTLKNVEKQQMRFEQYWVKEPGQTEIFFPKCATWYVYRINSSTFLGLRGGAGVVQEMRVFGGQVLAMKSSKASTL